MSIMRRMTKVLPLSVGLVRKPGPVWNREDIVIILKPRVTVALKDVYQHGELGAAFAAYLGTQAAASLSLLPTWEQNLIVAGTRDPHVADMLLRDFQLDSSKGQLLMHGHLKLTGEVCRGVITVANHETSESLQNKIQWRAGELADIRKLGNSNVAALTFVGKVVPRFVHYNSEVTLVRAYKRTIPACGRCGTVGHRADTCPCPDNDKCGLCGHTVPTADGVKAPHECTPSCAVCGQAHATNSRDCTGKFRQLKLPGDKAKRHKRRTTRRPKKPPSHPTPEANGGAPRGAHGADPKTRSPPPLSVTSAHGKKTAPSPPPPSGKDTSHFPALKTDGAAGARASTPQHGKQVSSWARVVSSSPRPSSSPPTVSQLDAQYKKQIDVLRAQNELLLNKIQNLESKLAPAAPSPQNSDAMESDAELSPALVATISAMEERLTSKLGSMIETAMDQILIKVMTAVPAMISKHIMDNPQKDQNRVIKDHIDGALQDEAVESVKDSEGCRVVAIAVEADAMNEGTPTDDATRNAGVAVQIKWRLDIAASTGDGTIIKEFAEPPAKAPSGRNAILGTKSHAKPEKRPIDSPPPQYSEQGPSDGPGGV
ncbi:hypothetical protein HPB49_002787 [Dermacentor silvarum]|uniref:Uncharacterized protein n=1 Tax=Dermacentor silvarum TaxID=543639 RepID=A0ACB8CPB2_DERSI|nr:hypothetical protein HPB49_002787 [Dermacentor silvarum]